MNHTSQQTAQTAPRPDAPSRAPRLSLSSRWTVQPTRPRLVTFSWGAVVPSMLHR